MTQLNTDQHPKPFLMLSSATMELCWMGTWASYTSYLFCGIAFPLPMAMVAFGLSAALAGRMENLTRTRWHLFVLHLTAATLAVAVMLTLSHYRFMAMVPNGWLELLRIHPRSISQWAMIIYLIISIILFWLSGLYWCRRSRTHQTICNRFDLGASLLFIFYIMKLALVRQLGIVMDTSIGFYFLGFFFISGLLSIGLAKNQNSFHVKSLGAFGGISILLFFVIAVIFFGLGFSLFFLPYTEGAAQSGYAFIKTMMHPVFLKAMKILAWLFQNSSEGPPPIEISNKVEQDQAHLVESILSENDKFMHDAMLGYTVMIMLLMGCAIWLFSKWMTARLGRKYSEIRFALRPWIYQLIRQAVTAIIEKVRTIRNKKDVVYYYTALIRWARRSGVVHRADETPREFGRRLMAQFPMIRKEIIQITECFNEGIYGAQSFDDSALAELHSAKKAISRPGLWPMRLQSKISIGFIIS